MGLGLVQSLGTVESWVITAASDYVPAVHGGQLQVEASISVLPAS